MSHPDCKNVIILCKSPVKFPLPGTCRMGWPKGIRAVCLRTPRGTEPLARKAQWERNSKIRKLRLGRNQSACENGYDSHCGPCSRALGPRQLAEGHPRALSGRQVRGGPLWLSGRRARQATLSAPRPRSVTRTAGGGHKTA